MEAQNGSARRMRIFACLAPNRTFSRHLLTIIIVVVLCCVHLRANFGIKLYAQMALVNKIGALLPFAELG